MTIKYISFEGGGVKGFAYAGVIKYFEDYKISLDDLEAISGTSIGSIVALAVAIKCTSIEIENLFIKYDNIFYFLTLKNIITVVPNLFMKYGLITTSELDIIISALLLSKNIDVDITFIDFYKLFNIDLVVTISNLNTSEAVFCSYISTPNMSVRQSCVISASFTIIFIPTILHDEYYTDGGVFANLPFNYFDRIYDKKETMTSAFGFLLDTPIQPITNIITYIENIIGSLIDKSTEKYYIEDGKIDSRIIKIPIDADIYSFSTLTTDKKNRLINSGYESTKKYFEVL